ncbi:MAG: ABC transporter ATP-binding protein [Coriobacteriaceae bacterium]|nr:ABC transporter ATP-binding protein [Coriobacteriaceae bacterium]
MTQAVLRTHALTKKYGGSCALDGVSLAVYEGDIYGLVGRNGAGKTTFFKCVMGLCRPSAGEVEINGDTGRLSASRRRMGFMISPSFFPYLGPRESLEYLCRVKGIAPAGEVDRLLGLVGLAGVRKPFKSFSLGMKQRLGIAGALLGSPSLVVLDEPINGLDPQGIIDMRELIKNVHAQTGATLVVSSHILSELDMVATRFGFIEQGVLLKEISHQDLHARTKKSLVIEVDDVPKACALLNAAGIEGIAAKGDQLVLQSHLDRAPWVARILVSGNIGLKGLHRQETTLEEYFMQLVGGGHGD